MANLYFGKFSDRFPNQITSKFYAAGPKGESWYHGLETGDFVFPIYKGAISELWRVIGYDNRDVNQSINPDGAVFFEVEKKLGKSYRLVSEFLRYRHFDLDLDMLNKSIKSTKGQGFYMIPKADGCPADPKQIDFGDRRNIYIMLEQSWTPPPFHDGDIRVVIDSQISLKIKDIEIRERGEFIRYELLWKIYEERNRADGLFSLEELLRFSETDLAPKKEKYLRAVIAELKDKGIFVVASPVQLYDNILVGRKRSAPSKSAKNNVGNITQAPEIGIEENDEQGDDDIEPTIDADIDTEIDADELEEFRKYLGLFSDQSPNLILYGPPGTGKTYTAQRIVQLAEYDRTKVIKKFSAIQKSGTADFVTFHQAFSYEEFVEGIRPEMGDQDGESIDSGLKYKIEDGILKRIAAKATTKRSLETFKDDLAPEIGKDAQVFKISLGMRNWDTTMYDNCIANNEIAIGWLPDQDLTGLGYNEIYSFRKAEIDNPDARPSNDASSIDYFVNVVQKGDLVLVYDSPSSIRDIGIVTGEYVFKPKDKSGFCHRRSVKWIQRFTEPRDILPLNGGYRLTLKTMYPLWRISLADVLAMIEPLNAITKEPELKDLEKDKFFLIIDEINRGNIARIFGELITLLEKDKRGKLSCTLPYSKKPFTLPPNLYVIGTMNTADRSIAILDSALRRRFVFEELEPDYTVLEDIEVTGKQSLDLESLLRTINERITKEDNRDHRIGHSYFMEAVTPANLKAVWYYQILPLLMDYFYNDGDKIATIIGGEFFADKRTCTIKRDFTEAAFVDSIRKIYETK